MREEDKNDYDGKDSDCAQHAVRVHFGQMMRKMRFDVQVLLKERECE